MTSRPSGTCAPDYSCVFGMKRDPHTDIPLPYPPLRPLTCWPRPPVSSPLTFVGSFLIFPPHVSWVPILVRIYCRTSLFSPFCLCSSVSTSICSFLKPRPHTFFHVSYLMSNLQNPRQKIESPIYRIYNNHDFPCYLVM